MPAEKPSLSYQDYLALELESGIKHQWLDGEVFAMTGGTPDHALLASNMIVGLGLALRGGPCRPYSGDLKLRNLQGDFASYPDMAVVCGARAHHPEDPNALTNPRVVVEVLSPGTEAFDRGEKFARYRGLESLREYVLVSTEVVRVEVYTRNEDGSWTMREHGAGGRLELPSVEAALEIDEIYEGTALAERFAGAGAER